MYYVLFYVSSDVWLWWDVEVYFMHKAAAVDWVYGRFASYVYGEVWFYQVLFVLTYLACILSSVVHSFSVFCLQYFGE